MPHGARQRSRVELYEYFASLPSHSRLAAMPRPIVNLFSGGRHAGGQVAIQDLLVVSMAQGVAEQVEQVCRSAANLVLDKYDMRELTADEGGPRSCLRQLRGLFRDAAEAVVASGLSLGDDICFAVDVAASEFFDGRLCHIDCEQLTADELVQLINRWCDQYPLLTVEDGLAEDKWQYSR